jgi:hypothetical protein
VLGWVGFAEVELVGGAGVLLERDEAALLEHVRLLADLDDLVGSRHVEEPGQQLVHRPGLAEPGQHVVVMVDLARIERVVRNGRVAHP